MAECHRFSGSDPPVLPVDPSQLTGIGASVSGRGRVSDQRIVACVGGSRVRERARVAARAFRVPHTNSLTPTPSHTRAPTRVPAIGDGRHAIARRALSRTPRHPKRKGRTPRGSAPSSPFRPGPECSTCVRQRWPRPCRDRGRSCTTRSWRWPRGAFRRTSRPSVACARGRRSNRGMSSRPR